MIGQAFLRSIAAVVIGLASSVLAAEPLPAPTEKPILTVSGKIAVANNGKMAQFDRPMIEALGMTSFETMTPWYKERVTFEGVPLAKLLDRLQASGKRLVVVALNDYTAELPAEDARNYNVMLAVKRNGQYMPVSDKGPLFVVYNYDSNPALKSQQFYARSVWQVTRIEVR